MAVKEELAKYLNQRACPECDGTRLRTEARNVKVADRTIHDLSSLPLAHAQPFFEKLELAGNKRAIAEKIVREIANRIQFLNNVGLDYLSLTRSADTLSGGEAQRIRLASQIGSGLTGVMYVLDEPSIGLHQRDNARLIETLKRLRDLGNSVIVVEHDEEAIEAADHVIDMGPGAGVHPAARSWRRARRTRSSPTPPRSPASTSRGRKSIPLPARRHKPDAKKQLRIAGARGNNLKDVTVDIPVGLFVAITGVSGSGKSTLINDTLYNAVAHHLYGSAAEPAEHDAIEGLDFFDKVINVDQSPIGRTPRSNPATYTGLFTPIRGPSSRACSASRGRAATGRGASRST